MSTPTTENVRGHFSADRLDWGLVRTIHDADSEFDRWLAEVKAEALREAANEMPDSRDLTQNGLSPGGCHEWLHSRADRLALNYP